MTPDTKAAQEMGKFTLGAFLQLFLFNKDLVFGSYFDYIQYMWSRRDQPGILLVFFEDLKRVSLLRIL